jgi:hypothetical protein
MDDEVTLYALIPVLSRRVGMSVDVTHWKASVEVSWDGGRELDDRGWVQVTRSFEEPTLAAAIRAALEATK